MMCTVTGCPSIWPRSMCSIAASTCSFSVYSTKAYPLGSCTSLSMASSTVFTVPKLLNISRRWSAVTLRVRLLTCRILGTCSVLPRRGARSVGESELELRRSPLRSTFSLSLVPAFLSPLDLSLFGEGEREYEYEYDE